MSRFSRTSPASSRHSSRDTHSTSTPSTHTGIPPTQIIQRRTTLPGSRAILGGVLVAAAAFATFLAASPLRGDSLVTVVVASRDLPAGHRLQSGDLTTLATPLADRLRGATIAKPSVVHDAVTLGPIRSGELVQPGQLIRPQADGVEISFALPASRALNGALRSGESVRVLASAKSSSTAAAATIVDQARVLKVDGGTSGLGRSDTLTVTLLVQNAEEATQLATAVDTGQLTLVRTTGEALRATPESETPPQTSSSSASSTTTSPRNAERNATPDPS